MSLDPSILGFIFLYLITLTQSNLCLFSVSSVCECDTNRHPFLKSKKSRKKCVDLQPTKLSKCNSYVAYCLRQILGGCTHC